MRPYAVITGASKGLGKCFALELAKRKINTILIALPDEGIGKVAEVCIEAGADSICYETDLTRVDNIIALGKWINEKYPVNILINNAGTGGTAGFSESRIEYLNNLIQINITATTLLTHQLMPNLLQQNEAYILNVSSIASFSPMANKAVYAASKNFIDIFTSGLREELKKTRVFVTAVYPGPMKTNKSITDRIKKQGLLGKIGLLTPEKVAEESIQGLFQKKRRIVIGVPNKISRMLLMHVPSWLRLPILSKAVKRENQLKVE